MKTITNELFSTHLQGNLSKLTMKRIFKGYGIRNYARKRKPFFSFQSRKARVRWASAVQDWQVAQWKDVVFSDECRFGLKNDCKTLRVWRTKQEVNDPTLFQQTFKNATSLMFWGCVGPTGVGKLVVCDRTVNAEKYVCLLHDNFFANVESVFGTADRPFIFQQDNAPPHRAAYTKIYLSLRGVPVLPWPAQSPDLNIIESIWLFIKNKFNCDPRGPSTTKKELQTRVISEWDRIPRNFIGKLYESLPRRIWL